jgi:predicted nucleotide-binding protein
MAQNLGLFVRQLIQEGQSIERAILAEEYLPKVGTNYSQLKAWISKLERLYSESDSNLTPSKSYFHKNRWPVWIKGGQMRLAQTTYDERKSGYKELLLILAAIIEPEKIELLNPPEAVKSKPKTLELPIKTKDTFKNETPDQIEIKSDNQENKAGSDSKLDIGTRTEEASLKKKEPRPQPKEDESNIIIEKNTNEIESLMGLLNKVLIKPNEQPEPQLVRDERTLKISKTLHAVPKKPMVSSDPTKVFLSFGRNSDINRALLTFLSSIGLSTLDFKDAIRLTGNVNPTIEEILDSIFSYAQVAIVILTPDDDVKLKKKYQQPNDSESDKNINNQARGSVLFEAGLLLGKHPERTILLQLGDIKTFSFFVDDYFLPFDGSPNSRIELATRLKALGCFINQIGQAWLTSGDFKL